MPENRSLCDNTILGAIRTGRRRHQPRAREVDAPGRRVVPRMFVFFSNRLGCVGSLLLSLVITIVLIAILNLLA